MVENWKDMEKVVEDLKDKDLSQEEDSWYRHLEGSSLCEKGKTMRQLYNKRIKVYKE